MGEGPVEAISVLVLEALSERDRRRVRELQELLRHQGQPDYVAAQKRAARRLGISVRSVQRLLQRWRRDGVSGVVRQERCDKGRSHLSEEWQGYILKTWREGNREGRRLSPAQVFLRVRARAADIGDERPPSHMSVYRLLGPEIEKRRRREQIGSVGWRGSRLQIKTRSGLEIDVDHSNQVWQVDHTKVDVLVVDQSGEVLGRPWLTTVVDSYSRC